MRISRFLVLTISYIAVSLATAHALPQLGGWRPSKPKKADTSPSPPFAETYCESKCKTLYVADLEDCCALADGKFIKLGEERVACIGAQPGADVDFPTCAAEMADLYETCLLTCMADE